VRATDCPKNRNNPKRPILNPIYILFREICTLFIETVSYVSDPLKRWYVSDPLKRLYVSDPLKRWYVSDP
jgi:hypothetical protein